MKGHNAWPTATVEPFQLYKWKDNDHELAAAQMHAKVSCGRQASKAQHGWCAQAVSRMCACRSAADCHSDYVQQVKQKLQAKGLDAEVRAIGRAQHGTAFSMAKLRSHQLQGVSAASMLSANTREPEAYCALLCSIPN